MGNYKHSVTLAKDKCKGCTNCLKRCPTEAIRIRNGHAEINSDTCVDCGECIRRCPYRAKRAVSDPLSIMEGFRYKVALPAPAFYGQFDHLNNINYILKALLDIGFDDVFEVARAAEIVSGYSKRYIMRPDVKNRSSVLHVPLLHGSSVFGSQILLTISCLCCLRWILLQKWPGRKQKKSTRS